MRFGLTYTKKSDMEEELRRRGVVASDDALEEYDSEETIRAIEDALVGLGHEVVRFGWGRELVARLCCRDCAPVDLVFNIAEGFGGRSREAQVPALLDMLGVPYVGSDPLALAVSLDKGATRAMCAAAAVPVPRGFVASSVSEALVKRTAFDLEFPIIIKPLHEGSSRGVRHISVCDNEVEFGNRLPQMLAEYQQPVMVEDYIDGVEVTVGIAGDPAEVIGVMEIAPRNSDSPRWRVYGIEVKRDYERLVDYLAPPKFNGDLLEDVKDVALRAYHVLGCRDVARIDFKVSVGGKPYLLDINPLPGLHPVRSDLVIMMRLLGVSHTDLVGRIIEGAVRRLAQRAQAVLP